MTSRETKRWIIPKGWPMKGKAPHQAAAREAFQEAGLVGSVRRRPIGTYDYEKRLKSGAFVQCHVEVFPFEVAKQRRRWPEFAQRSTEWFPASQAAAAVAEPSLSAMIQSLENGLATG